MGSSQHIPASTQKVNHFHVEEHDGSELKQAVQEQPQDEPAPIPTPEEPKPEATQAPAPPPRPPRNYMIEMIFVPIVLVYALVFWVGKRLNERIVRTHTDSLLPLLQQQFARVGDPAEGGVVVKEGHASFYVKAAGRAGCVGMQISFLLRKRHDIASMVADLIWPTVDTLIIDVLMEDEMPPTVFSVLRRRDEKKTRKALKDLSDFCGPTMYPDVLPNSLCVVAESDELAQQLLTPQVANTLRNYESLVQSVHISDQNIVSKEHKNGMTFKFTLPSEDAPEKCHLLLKLALFLVEHVQRVRLSKQAAQKAEKRRLEVRQQQEKEQHQKRQEDAQARKEAKLKKEKEAWSKLTDEEREKKERKLKEKEMRRKSAKMAKVMKIGA